MLPPKMGPGAPAIALGWEIFGPIVATTPVGGMISPGRGTPHIILWDRARERSGGEPRRCIALAVAEYHLALWPSSSVSSGAVPHRRNRLPTRRSACGGPPRGMTA